MNENDTGSSSDWQDVLNDLDLPWTLQERIHVVGHDIIWKQEETRTKSMAPTEENIADSNRIESLSSLLSHKYASSSCSFVLYLPTVVLRREHNPALALACRLANYWRVPLLILVTVLDDSHHHVDAQDHLERIQQECDKEKATRTIPTATTTATTKTSMIVGTARRYVFQLQAIQAAARAWAATTGCTVLVRVHAGSGTRTPDHLTATARAMTMVVTDEPFVNPYRSYVESIERAAIAAGKICLRVDGSTTVPPISVLKKRQIFRNCAGRPMLIEEEFSGVPDKAWKWQRLTEPKRRAHVNAVLEQGHFDAPQLLISTAAETDSLLACDTDHHNDHPLRRFLPGSWRDPARSAPWKRPWSMTELDQIDDFALWITAWSNTSSAEFGSIDMTVPPCPQTHGASGWRRWEKFCRDHIQHYAQRRNNAADPHAVSRMSCYLNIGTVSIFRIVYELWGLQQQQRDSRKNNQSRGIPKFYDEIVKWREISYAHCFALRDYFGLPAIPAWSRRYLESCCQQQQKQSQPLQASRCCRGVGPGTSTMTYRLATLANGQTDDPVWNAMQQYLVQTGELHNNARMTWGKTALHWLLQLPSHDIFSQLAYLNDRYALDGLSPCSYAGLLWCFGWCDKPATHGSISTKSTNRYRLGPDAFRTAQQRLLVSSLGELSRLLSPSLRRINTKIVQPTPPRRPSVSLNASSTIVTQDHDHDNNNDNSNDKHCLVVDGTTTTTTTSAVNEQRTGIDTESTDDGQKEDDRNNTNKSINNGLLLHLEPAMKKFKRTLTEAKSTFNVSCGSEIKSKALVSASTSPDVQNVDDKITCGTPLDDKMNCGSFCGTPLLPSSTPPTMSAESIITTMTTTTTPPFPGPATILPGSDDSVGGSRSAEHSPFVIQTASHAVSATKKCQATLDQYYFLSSSCHKSSRKSQLSKKN